MPSRKLTDRCPSCRTKNQFRARYCGECGTKLADNRAEVDERGRPRLYVDVAHPINAEAREGIEQAVLAAYREEEERAKQPDYRPAPLYEEEAEEPEEFEEPAREDEQPAQPAAPEPPVTSAPEPPRRSTPKPPPTSPPKKPGEAGRRFGEGIFDGEEPEGPAEQ
jgi:stage V sporulation protein G